MKAIWKTDPSETWPHWEDIFKTGVTRISFPTMVAILEKGVLKEWVTNIRETRPEFKMAIGTHHNFQYAQHRNPGWNGLVSPSDIANAVDYDLDQVGGSLLTIPYMLNMEYPYRDPDFLVEVFNLIRKREPRGPLSWAMEPDQGGWIMKSKRLVDFINNDINFVVVPELFGGGMEPWPADQVRKDMEATGIAKNRIKLFYDAAHPRPVDWDGCLFHAERLVV